jgi:DNA (cytosine-5)-methyltransferase 1
MTRPRLLDLFCGAGGAAMGYHRAGFDVVGVDLFRQHHFPFEFVQADALDLDPGFVRSFEAIHASPPCQLYTRKPASFGRERKHFAELPDLVGPTRALLQATGKPWAMENVPGAPMRSDVMLCGSQFGLRIIKHRHFELSFTPAFLLPSCNHRGAYYPFEGEGRSAAEHREAQGTPWIPIHGGRDRKAGRTGDLNNAIPPAYTEWVGGHLLRELRQ